MNDRYAKNILVRNLVTLSPHSDVFDAIQLLLKNNITGAPVIDETGKLLGVFSDKSCMTVLAAVLSKSGQTDETVDALPKAKDIMVARVMTMTPEMDGVEAIGRLLKRQVSGAPVIDDEGKFMGIYSERYAMRVLIGIAYERLPSMDVSQCMNTDSRRTIFEDVDIPTMVQMFVDDYFRRLCVLRNDRLVGQVSRRDVLGATSKLMLTTDSWRESIRNYERSHEEYCNTPAEGAFMVSTFMNQKPQTIVEDTDFLSMAQIFLNTNNRRLPVLRDGKLIGQISRCDLLQAVYELIADTPERKSSLLYVSALMKSGEAPFE